MDRETLDIDVLFVGAGPASLAGAYHLANLIRTHNETSSAKIPTPTSWAGMKSALWRR